MGYPSWGVRLPCDTPPVGLVHALTALVYRGNHADAILNVRCIECQRHDAWWRRGWRGRSLLRRSQPHLDQVVGEGRSTPKVGILTRIDSLHRGLSPTESAPVAQRSNYHAGHDVVGDYRHGFKGTPLIEHPHHRSVRNTAPACILRVDEQRLLASVMELLWQVPVGRVQKGVAFGRPPVEGVF